MIPMEVVATERRERPPGLSKSVVRTLACTICIVCTLVCIISLYLRMYLKYVPSTLHSKV